MAGSSQRRCAAAAAAPRNYGRPGALPFADVTMLLKDRPTESPAEGGAPASPGVAVAAPDFACEACGAAMARGQDWCLECGSAAPGRLGARPGWRAAFTVVGLTSLLLVCGVVAAYAALTSDAQRTASAPPAGSADPITAQVPAGGVPATAPPAVAAPGVTGPGVTPPPPAAGTKPIIPIAPVPPGTNRPVAPPPPPPAATKPGATSPAGSPGSSSSDGGSGSTPTTPAPAATNVIAFKKDAAQTYDPGKRAGAEFGPPKNAIDGRPGTVWDVVVPADDKPIAAGLVIDLGKPYALRSLRLATPTEGFKVEVYGAKSAKELPQDVIDKRWIHLTDDRSTLDDELILLKGKGDGAKVQLLLLYFTTPPDPADPRVAISGVTLRGTP